MVPRLPLSSDLHGLEGAPQVGDGVDDDKGRRRDEGQVPGLKEQHRAHDPHANADVDELAGEIWAGGCRPSAGTRPGDDAKDVDVRQNQRRVVLCPCQMARSSGGSPFGCMRIRGLAVQGDRNLGSHGGIVLQQGDVGAEAGPTSLLGDPAEQKGRECAALNAPGLGRGQAAAMIRRPVARPASRSPPAPGPRSACRLDSPIWRLARMMAAASPGVSTRTSTGSPLCRV